MPVRLLLLLILGLPFSAIEARDLEVADRALAAGQYETAIPLYEQLADAGDASAQVSLASLYQRGEGVERNIAKAVVLYQAAANQGDAEAEFNLGNMFLLGEGVAHDEEWALTYYRRAAAKGHQLAEQNLREMLRANGIKAGSEEGDAPATTAVAEASTERNTPTPSNASVNRPLETIDGVAAVATPPSSGAKETAQRGADPRDGLAPSAAPAVEEAVTQSAPAPSPDTGTGSGAVAVVAGSAQADEKGATTPTDSPIVQLDPVKRPVVALAETPSADELGALRLAREHGIEVDLSAAGQSPAQTPVNSPSPASDPAVDSPSASAVTVPGKPLHTPLSPQAAEEKYQLAQRHMRGEGVDPDEAMAITLYREAARSGHADAAAKLSAIYADAGIAMPDFSRPRTPIAIHAAASTVENAARGAEQAVAAPTPSGVIAAAPLPIAERSSTISPISKPDPVVETNAPAEQTSPARLDESSGQPGRSLEPLPPLPPAKVTDSSPASTPAFTTSTIDPAIIVRHPAAHETLSTASAVTLEPVKPADHLVLPGSVMATTRPDQTPRKVEREALPDQEIMRVPDDMATPSPAQFSDGADDVVPPITELAEVSADDLPSAKPDSASAPATESLLEDPVQLPAVIVAEEETALPAVTAPAVAKRGFFDRLKGVFVKNESKTPEPASPVVVAQASGDPEEQLALSAPASPAMNEAPARAAEDQAFESVALEAQSTSAQSTGSLAARTPSTSVFGDDGIDENDVGDSTQAGAESSSDASESAGTAVSIDAAKRALADGELDAAAQMFSVLAEAGDAAAQAHLGYMYYKGEGVETNLRLATDWYRRSAVQGNRDAQYNLAVAYAFGEGVAQDDAQAVTWYRRAAEQGSAIAQYSLGVSYALGEGVVQNDAEAIRWYRAAAEQGYAAAQYNLGYSYRTGHGIEVDDTEALRWFAAAAQNGHASAQYSLGYMFRSGRGVERDLEQAIKWYRLAAAQGHADARADLASLNTAEF